MDTVLAVVSLLVSVITAGLLVYRARPERKQTEADTSEKITAAAMSLLDPLQERITELNDMLTATEGQIQTLQNQREADRLRIVELERALTVNEAQVQTLRAQREADRLRIVELERTVKALRAENLRLRRVLDEHQIELCEEDGR